MTARGATGLTRAVGVLGSALVFLAGQGMLGTLLGVTAHAHAFSNSTVGMIGSSYYLGFVSGCWSGPLLIRRFTHRRVFAAVLLVAAAVTLTFPLSAIAAAWMIARATFGFAAAITYTLIESWLNQAAQNNNRGRVLGSYLLTKQMGSTLGQALMIVLPLSPSLLFAVPAGLIALALLPTLAVPPESPAFEHTRPIPLRLVRTAPAGTTICALTGLANGAIWTLAPVYGVLHGFPRGWAGAFMGAFILGGAAMQYPIGWLSDHVDRRRVILVAALVAAASGALLASLALPARGTVLALMTVFGMASLPLYGLGVALTNDRIGAEERVPAAATLLLLNGLASALGPALAGLATDRLGIAAIFDWTMAVHLSIAAFAAGIVRPIATAKGAARG